VILRLRVAAEGVNIQRMWSIKLPVSGAEHGALSRKGGAFRRCRPRGARRKLDASLWCSSRKPVIESETWSSAPNGPAHKR